MAFANKVLRHYPRAFLLPFVHQFHLTGNGYHANKTVILIWVLFLLFNMLLRSAAATRLSYVEMVEADTPLFASIKFALACLYGHSAPPGL